MSTPSEIAARRTHHLIIALIALVIVLVLALTATVIIATRSSGGNDPAAQASPAPPSPLSPSDTSSGGPLRLPAGAEMDGRYPIGFEHTPEGAVAMTAAYLTHDVTLDSEVKARTRATYFVEWQGEEVSEDQAYQARVNVQRDLGRLGIETHQDDLPTQADLSAIPLAVFYEPEGENSVDVALMGRFTATDGLGGGGTTLETLEVRCVWDEQARGGDWVLAAEFPEISPPEEIEPETAAFADSEWIKIQGGIGS